MTGYPLLFQPQITSSGLSCPLLPFDATALDVADQITAALNDVIEGVVSVVPTGSVVTYVDVTGADAFGGHGLCDGAAASYIFPPTFAPATGQPMPSSLHPTPAGQMAYAEAIADAGFLTTALNG